MGKASLLGDFVERLSDFTALVTLWYVFYTDLLHWRLCGESDRCIGDSVVIGSCMSCVFKLLAGLSLSPVMRFEASESSSVMNS